MNEQLKRVRKERPVLYLLLLLLLMMILKMMSEHLNEQK